MSYDKQNHPEKDVDTHIHLCYKSKTRLKLILRVTNIFVKTYLYKGWRKQNVNYTCKKGYRFTQMVYP